MSYAVPNYKDCCQVCGELPTIDVANKSHEIIHYSLICGVCCWGEPAMLNPDNWNDKEIVSDL